MTTGNYLRWMDFVNQSMRGNTKMLKRTLDGIVLGEKYIQQQKDIMRYLDKHEHVITEDQICDDLELTRIQVRTHFDDMYHNKLVDQLGTWHWQLTDLGTQYVREKL